MNQPIRPSLPQPTPAVEPQETHENVEPVEPSETGALTHEAPATTEASESVETAANINGAPTEEAAVVFRDITKAYTGNQLPALSQITTTINKGDFVYLVGPSGSGKSTLLKLIIREEKPTVGALTVAGYDLTRIPRRKIPKLRRNIGMVFQDYQLLDNKTVAGNIAFALDVIGKPRRTIKKLVPEVLELVGLEDKADRMPDELSGGEQQRVAIARAFINRPQILLADEPTGNLDPDTSYDIMKLLERINNTGITVVMATHDATIVDKMRKRVIQLEAGHIVRDEAEGAYNN